MAITTSTSIREPKPPGPCVVCGHFGGLFVRAAQGGLVHAFDEHPAGAVPVEVELLPIAHNAVGDEDGAFLPALEHLRDIGHGSYGAGLTSMNPVSGDVRPRIDLVKVRKEMERSTLNAPALPVPKWMEEDVFAADRSQARPLGANRKKKD